MKNLKKKLFKVRLMSAILASVEFANVGITSYAMMPDFKTLDDERKNVASTEDMEKMLPQELFEYLKTCPAPETTDYYHEDEEFDKSSQDILNFDSLSSESKTAFFEYVLGLILDNNIQNFNNIPSKIKTDIFQYAIDQKYNLVTLLLNLGISREVIDNSDISQFIKSLAFTFSPRMAGIVLGKIHANDDPIISAILADDPVGFIDYDPMRDYNAKTQLGCTPIEYATLLGSERIFRFLLSNHVKITYNTLKYALAGENCQIIQTLARENDLSPVAYDVDLLQLLAINSSHDILYWLKMHFIDYVDSDKKIEVNDVCSNPKVKSETDDEIGNMSPEYLWGYLNSTAPLSRDRIKKFQNIPTEEKIKFWEYVLNNKTNDEVKSLLRRFGVAINTYSIVYFLDSMMQIATSNIAVKILNKLFIEEGSIASTIANNDMDAFQYLLARPFSDINAKVFGGLTLIEYAALLGNQKIFKYLIMNNANLTDRLMALALIGGNCEIIHICEQQHCSLSLKNDYLKSILINESDLDILTWTNIHFKGPSYEEIIKNCCQSNNLSLLKKIYENVSIEELIKGFKAAAMNNNLEIMKFLFEHGVDINADGKPGWTALMHSVDSRDLNMTNFLLDKGVSVDHVSVEELVECFEKAATNNNLEIIKFLFEHGVNISREKLANSLTIAAENNNLEIVEFLLKQGVDVNATGKFSWTVLMHAVRSGNSKMVRLLLDSGADVNAVSSEGNCTALSIASINSSSAMIDLLKENGATR